MVRQICFFLFFKYVLLIMLLQLSHFFSPLYPPLPCTILPTSTPLPYFMSMGHTYKFFGFSISHTILNLPQSILYLPCMLLNHCTFPLILPPLSPSQPPTDNPPCDLHFCASVPVLVICLVFFCFCFRCGC